ncbi:hypothetical protein MAR_005880 [Mya arenaria]|uniref:Uncharacterized protein n=1 Tax=Mya arenaria TaxID=6604 RepID=A0ABY7F248_MYAAR|nr:hypothetical protein MAR_005880 [Mya arenaria]
MMKMATTRHQSAVNSWSKWPRDSLKVCPISPNTLKPRHLAMKWRSDRHR